MNSKTLKTLSFVMMGLSLLSMILVWRFTDPAESKTYNMISVGFMMVATMLLVQARQKEGR